jgi:hypothetical protein
MELLLSRADGFIHLRRYAVGTLERYKILFASRVLDEMVNHTRHQHTDLVMDGYKRCDLR